MKQESLTYQSILANMSDGVMTVNVKGKIITFNEAAEQILGVKSEEVLNKPFAEHFLLQEGFDAFNQTILDAVYESETIHNQIVTIEKDDETIKLEITTSFIQSGTEEGKKKIAVIAVFNNITELEKLREKERQLTEELKSKHRELQDAFVEIESKNSSLSSAIKKGKVVRIFTVIFVLILMFGGGYYTWSQKKISFANILKKKQPAEKKQVVTRSLTVKPRMLLSSVSLAAEVLPLEVVSVTSPYDGVVKEKYFNYGQVVRKGQLLIKMDTQDVEAKYRDSEAAYIKAVEKLENLINWNDSNEVSRAKRSISKSKLSLETQKQELKETENLLKKGIVPASEYDNAKRQYENMMMDYESAQEELKSVLAKADQENTHIAELELENARIKKEKLERDLKHSKLFAPVSGTVIQSAASEKKDKKNSIVKGSKMNAGEIIISIGNIDGFSFKIQVDEINIGKIKIGQKAKVTGDAFPGILLKGEVNHISSEASKGKGGKGIPTFDVLVSIKDISTEAKERIHLGMTANVELIIYEKPDALLVPINTVMSIKGERFIKVKDKKTQKTKKVKVKTGFTTLDSVEILEGLKPGDEVVL